MSQNKHDREDAEANEFASRLLVPDMLLEREDLTGLDFNKDATLHNLAKKYRVSLFVMATRLQQFKAEHRK